MFKFPTHSQDSTPELILKKPKTLNLDISKRDSTQIVLELRKSNGEIRSQSKKMHVRARQGNKEGSPVNGGRLDCSSLENTRPGLYSRSRHLPCLLTKRALSLSAKYKKHVHVCERGCFLDINSA